MKLKIFSRWRELRDARHEPEGRKSLSRVYWATLIIFFFIFSVSFIVYGIWQFSLPLRGVESEAKVAAPQIPLQRGELQAVLEAFDERTMRFEERQGGEPAAPANR